jgi:hypothetical protein
MSSGDIAQKFLRFAERAKFSHNSPLYSHLSSAVAEDNQLLWLASSATAGQPIPQLFFGAVHYLLPFHPGDPLAHYYPTLSGDATGNPEASFPAFRNFIFHHQNEIVDILNSRFVQTNSVERCSYLFPAMLFAAEFFQGQPLAMVEIGCSTGLNLLWDCYSYTYGGSGKLGDANSPVDICCELRENSLALSFNAIPVIDYRIGLDLHVVDHSCTDSIAWLRALIYPEHRSRREKLEAALRFRSSWNLDLRDCDGFASIQAVIDEVPPNNIPVIYHTNVANQISSYLSHECRQPNFQFQF